MLTRTEQASGYYNTINWTQDTIAPLKPETDELAQSVDWPDETPLTVQGNAVLLCLILRKCDRGQRLMKPNRHSITEPFQRRDQHYAGSGLMLSIM